MHATLFPCFGKAQAIKCECIHAALSSTLGKWAQIFASQGLAVFQDQHWMEWLFGWMHSFSGCCRDWKVMARNWKASGRQRLCALKNHTMHLIIEWNPRGVSCVSCSTSCESHCFPGGLCRCISLYLINEEMLPALAVCMAELWFKPGSFDCGLSNPMLIHLLIFMECSLYAGQLVWFTVHRWGILSLLASLTSEFLVLGSFQI